MKSDTQEQKPPLHPPVPHIPNIPTAVPGKRQKITLDKRGGLCYTILALRKCALNIAE